MLTSRTMITALLIIGTGALGWVGGSRYAHHDEEAEVHGHAQTNRENAAHPSHAHDRKTDAHAGHNHGKPAAGESAEFCAEHRLPEAEDVLCNPGLMTLLLPGEGLKLRLGTPEAARRAGITLAPAQPTATAGGPAIPARIVYNRGRVAEVMALSGGVVKSIAAEPGQRVAKGALLAELTSPAAAGARAELQAALGRLQLTEANVKRERELVAKGVSARLELEQAQAEQQTAAAIVWQLREQLAAFGAGTTDSGGTALGLRSPIHGTIVARQAVTGQTLAAETPLFTVADLSSMWLEMWLGADQLALVKPGSAIEAEVDGLPGERFPGKIVQVHPGLDERTRRLRVIAEVANPDGRLKDGLFGLAHLGPAPGAATSEAEHRDKEGDHDHDHGASPGATSIVNVPGAAVQTIDGKAYVFVAHDEADLFELRRVEVGPRRGGETLIVAGLRGGERVAASQGFALKSELLKSRLGASCADH